MAIYKSDIVDVELENGNISRSFLKHSIGSGDADANRFGMKVFRNGVPEDLTGASCQAIFMNASGVNIALTSYGTVDGNIAYVTLPQACYNVEGQFTLAIKLVKSGVTMTSRIVDGVVDNTGTTGTVAPTSSVPTYQEIIAQYDAMVEATEAAQAAADLVAVADEFNAATAYSAGKYLLNDGALYRLTADHAANVAWSSTSKVEVNLGDEVTLLNTNTVKNQAIAEQFDAAKVYSAGKYMLKDGAMYRLTADHAADVAWSSTSKTEVKLGDDITVLNSTESIEKESLSWTDGAFINDSNVIKNHEYSSYCDYVEIPANCTAVIHTFMRAQLRTIIYAEDKSVLSKYNNTDATYPNLACTFIIEKSTAKRYARISTYTEFKSDVFIIPKMTVSDIVASMGNRVDGTNTYLTDCDNAEQNRIYTITAQISNAPENKYGTLICLNGANKSGVNGTIQLFIASTREVYSRIHWGSSGGTWTAWKKTATTDDAIIQIGTRQATGTTVLTDCDSALANRIYTIVDPIDNCPKGKSGTLMTFNGDTSYTTGQAQIYVTRYGEIFTRIKWGGSGGTWTSWQQGLTNTDIYSGICLFERFGVIGDSFASGTIYTPGVTSDRVFYQLSWGQILARQQGITCVNYSKGGYNTYAFVKTDDTSYNTYGLGKVLSDISNNSACGLYLLCLGINDSNNTRTYGDKTGGADYLGLSSDIKSDPAQNGNSFWGNYGRIISAIQTASPSSRIILCTFKRIPTTATADAYESYRSAIVAIAEHFSLPCIQLDDDAFFNSSFYMNQMVGSHPTGPQYVGYAKAMERLISKTMVDYYDYFKGYIGVQS